MIRAFPDVNEVLVTGPALAEHERRLGSQRTRAYLLREVESVAFVPFLNTGVAAACVITKVFAERVLSKSKVDQSKILRVFRDDISFGFLLKMGCPIFGSLWAAVKLREIDSEEVPSTVSLAIAQTEIPVVAAVPRLGEERLPSGPIRTYRMREWMNYPQAYIMPSLEISSSGVQVSARDVLKAHYKVRYSQIIRENLLSEARCPLWNTILAITCLVKKVWAQRVSSAGAVGELLVLRDGVSFGFLFKMGCPIFGSLWAQKELQKIRLEGEAEKARGREAFLQANSVFATPLEEVDAIPLERHRQNPQTQE